MGRAQADRQGHRETAGRWNRETALLPGGGSQGHQRVQKNKEEAYIPQQAWLPRLDGLGRVPLPLHNGVQHLRRLERTRELLLRWWKKGRVHPQDRNAASNI